MDKYTIIKNDFIIMINMECDDIFFNDGMDYILKEISAVKSIIDIKADKYYRVYILIDTSKQMLTRNILYFDILAKYDLTIYITTQKKQPNILYNIKTSNFVMIDSKKKYLDMKNVISERINLLSSPRCHAPIKIKSPDDI